MSTIYRHTEAIHNLIAPREIAPYIMQLIHPKSVLDVGCGTGTWLKAFEELGISDYLGVDGDYVDRQMLKISDINFISQDLTKEWSVGRKFDLVISLEVAEHLPEESADRFVRILTAHGDNILFSAAIPGQGGQNHLNEQWPEYWRQKFERYGFYFHDLIRPIVWNNKKIEWWYRQNIFILNKTKPTEEILPLVHPECFRHQMEVLEGINRSILTGKLGILESMKIFIRSVLSQRLF